MEMGGGRSVREQDTTDDCVTWSLPPPLPPCLLVSPATQEAENHTFKASWGCSRVYGVPYVLISEAEIKLERGQGYPTPPPKGFSFLPCTRTEQAGQNGDLGAQW